MLSLVLVDYKSINQTIAFVLHASQNIVNSGTIQSVIVDNSPEPQEQVLRDQFGCPDEANIDDRHILIYETGCGKIAYWFANENLGYAKGNNIGLEIADRLFEPTYYIISNNDIVFLDKLDWNAVKRIFENNNKVAVIGPKLVYPDGHEEGPFLELSAFRFLLGMYWCCGPIQFPLREPPSRKSGKCYCTCGCFIIVDSFKFRQVGCFDANTFMYCEEEILAERLKKAELEFFYWREYSIFHNHNMTREVSSKQVDEWTKESVSYYLANSLSTSCLMMVVFRVSYCIFRARKRVLSPIKKLIHWDERKKRME